MRVKIYRDRPGRDARLINYIHRRYSGTVLPVMLGLAAVLLTAASSGAQTTCAMRADLTSNQGVSWADLRAACEADQAAYKQKNPVGFSWFINAGNGFTGVPYLLQRVLP